MSALGNRHSKLFTNEPYQKKADLGWMLCEWGTEKAQHVLCEALARRRRTILEVPVTKPDDFIQSRPLEFGKRARFI